MSVLSLRFENHADAGHRHPHGHGETIVSESDFIEKTEGAQLLFI